MNKYDHDLGLCLMLTFRNQHHKVQEFFLESGLKCLLGVSSLKGGVPCSTVQVPQWTRDPNARRTHVPGSQRGVFYCSIVLLFLLCSHASENSMWSLVAMRILITLPKANWLVLLKREIK